MKEILFHHTTVTPIQSPYSLTAKYNPTELSAIQLSNASLQKRDERGILPSQVSLEKQEEIKY